MIGRDNESDIRMDKNLLLTIKGLLMSNNYYSSVKASLEAMADVNDDELSIAITTTADENKTTVTSFQTNSKVCKIVSVKT